MWNQYSFSENKGNTKLTEDTGTHVQTMIIVNLCVSQDMNSDDGLVPVHILLHTFRESIYGT